MPGELLGERRPRVVLIAAATADGKLSSFERISQRFGSPEDRRRMRAVRAASDAILVGAGTLRADDPPLAIPDEVLVRARVREGRSPLPAAAVMTRSLDIPPSARIFSAPGRPVYLLCPESTPAPEAGRFPPSVEVVRAGREEVEPLLALQALHERGAESVLLEGGGATTAAFFAKKLVDELYLTICPAVLGGASAPTLVDGAGFPMDRRIELTLLSCEATSDGEVFLHYEVDRVSS